MNKNKSSRLWFALFAVAVSEASTAAALRPESYSASSSQGAGVIETREVENPGHPVSRPLDSAEAKTVSPETNGPSYEPGNSAGPAFPKRDAAYPSHFPSKPVSPPAPVSRLEPKTDNGTIYLCGGIGSDESGYMKQAGKNYDLVLTFSVSAGNYLANVNIDISDSSGRSVLKTSCDAPMLLVNLPRAGDYRIQAESGGQTIMRNLRIQTQRAGNNVTMVWPR